MPQFKSSDLRKEFHQMTTLKSQIYSWQYPGNDRKLLNLDAKIMKVFTFPYTFYKFHLRKKCWLNNWYIIRCVSNSIRFVDNRYIYIYIINRVMPPPIYSMWSVNYQHFKLFILCICLVCFRFCLMCSKLDLVELSVKQGGIKYHFWVFGMTRPGIECRSPGEA